MTIMPPDFHDLNENEAMKEIGEFAARLVREQPNMPFEAIAQTCFLCGLDWLRHQHVGRLN